MRSDRVSRRVMRATMRIDRVPSTATGKRQPNGVMPKTYSPSAVSGSGSSSSPGLNGEWTTDYQSAMNAANGSGRSPSATAAASN